jgi:hypothetical protein
MKLSAKATGFVIDAQLVFSPDFRGELQPELQYLETPEQVLADVEYAGDDLTEEDKAAWLAGPAWYLLAAKGATDDYYLAWATDDERRDLAAAGIVFEPLPRPKRKGE